MKKPTFSFPKICRIMRFVLATLAPPNLIFLLPSSAFLLPPFPHTHLEMYGIWLSGESELVGVSSRGAKSLIASGVRGPSSVASTSPAEPSTSFRSGRRFPSEENSSAPNDARDDGSTIKSLGEEVDVRGGVACSRCCCC